ncbi:MAG TPA: SIS domain-containing protein [Acidimicrobiia bacterium]|nr:SIS domain-containing protein [Acidimicrobiia bacterium]
MTYMAEEIRQAPEVIDRLLVEGRPAIRAAARAFADANPTWIAIAARGTSDHAAIYARYLIEAILGLPVVLTAPSIDTVYGRRSDWSGGLLLSISQSGESPDLLAVVEAAKRSGCPTLTITNQVESPLAQGSDHVIDYLAGVERSVAATKTYVASLAAIAGVVEAIDPSAGFDTGALPDLAQLTIDAAGGWVADSGVVEAFAESAGSLVVGRGYNLATASEVALKLIETSQRFAIAYSAADVEHGPMVLAMEQTPVLFIESPGSMGVHTRPLQQRLIAADADLWTVATRPHSSSDANKLILPIEVSDELSPIPLVLPGQLLAESVSRHLGFDPDSPKGLTKVTRTL